MHPATHPVTDVDTDHVETGDIDILTGTIDATFEHPLDVNVPGGTRPGRIQIFRRADGELMFHYDGEALRILHCPVRRLWLRSVDGETHLFASRVATRPSHTSTVFSVGPLPHDIAARIHTSHVDG